MNSNEEYLDNLLKSMNESDNNNSNIIDKEVDTDNNTMSPEEIEAMLNSVDEVPNHQTDKSDLYNDNKQSDIEYDDVIDTNEENQFGEVNNDEEKKSEEKESEDKNDENTLEDILGDEIDHLSDDEAVDQVEDTINDKEQDINSIVNEDVRNSGQESNENVLNNHNTDDNDLDALLKNLNDNDDLKEINELLKKSDNNEPVEMSQEDIFNNLINLDKDNNDEKEQEQISTESSETINKKKKKREKKEKRKSKEQDKSKEDNIEENLEDHQKELQEENNNDDVVKSTKKKEKKGFFGKFAKLMTEEDEAEVASNENQDIMDQLAAEDIEEANRKKKIKKGKSFGKGKSEEDIDGDVVDVKEKKDKKTKKPAKPKKEKPPKPIKEKIPEKPSKKISKKSIFVVFLFSASVFAALLFGIYLGSTMIQKSSAIKAFEKQDYITCYEQLYGMKLSEKEQDIFYHSEIILKLQRRIDMYIKYLKDDHELEAIDSLMRALEEYDELYAKAVSYNAEKEVIKIYEQILNILDEKYYLNEENARLIADCKNNIDYTRYLSALIDGAQLTSGENGNGIVLPQREDQDVLPAEQEIDEPNFAE